MRKHFILTALTALLLPIWTGGTASAQDINPNDTLQAVIRHGVILNSQGHSIPITYREDGTYSGEVSGVTFSGNWRLKQEARMCTSSSLSPLETCAYYPEGMAPGDTFEVTSATLGLIRITIREESSDRS
ncbi:hypothetical protein [Henriciella sp.]|uniref:hypothetical protein n=1 Tax=Henriciella sp. TaxID=1968823 RepID=UPI00262C9686|nr:hypothetical protein [Henriciella sp.]